jgi:PIN domain nuclease of toxin-antitoxin system
LPARCIEWFEDRGNGIAISAVSGYEIRFKAEKGLLPGGEALAGELRLVAEEAGFAVLSLTLQHAVAAGALPLPHRGPFDRMIAAQAAVEGYAVLSADLAFDGLRVRRVW